MQRQPQIQVALGELRHRPRHGSVTCNCFRVVAASHRLATLLERLSNRSVWLCRLRDGNRAPARRQYDRKRTEPQLLRTA